MTNDVTTRDEHESSGSEPATDTGSSATSRVPGSGPDRGPPSGTGTPAFDRWREETRATLAGAETARIDVYLRSMLPPPGAKDAQLSTLADLTALTDVTAVEDVTVNVWGERLCLCEDCRATDIGRMMLDRVRQFERWGLEYDASASAFFERTRQHSSVVGDAHEGITPPRVTAALVVDGSLRAVFPARFGDEAYSVGDFAWALGRNPEDSSRDIGDSHRDRVESTH